MIRRLIPYSRSWSMERSMMDKQEKRLKALWLRRQRSAEPSAASLDLAEWVETSETAEPENGPIESLLASSRSAREAVDGLRRGVETHPISRGTRERCFHAILRELEPPSKPQIAGRLGWTRVVASLAAAVVVAASGFLFGRVAAPATSQVTSDFVSIATFDIVADPANLEPLLYATGLTASASGDLEITP